MKFLNLLKDIFTSKQAYRFYWQTFDGAIGVVIVYLTGISWIYAPLIIAVLQGITKEISNKYLQ